MDKKVIATKQPKEYEVEVYVSFGSTDPYTSAGIVNSKDCRAYRPVGDTVERYVFKITDPRDNLESE